MAMRTSCVNESMMLSCRRTVQPGEMLGIISLWEGVRVVEVRAEQWRVCGGGSANAWRKVLHPVV